MTDSLTTLLLERLSQIIPESQLASILEYLKQTPATSFRVNTIKAEVSSTIEALKQQGITPTDVTWCQNAFTIPDEQRHTLTHSLQAANGEIYIQSLSSMLAPIILDPKPGEEILDLTAAPGSKTSQMAALMNNQGRIAAVEKVKARYFKLQDNLTSLGVSCVNTYLKDGANVWRSCQNRFDRVLLDAPCSSEGRINLSDPSTYTYWSEKKIKEMSKKQWPLLHSAFQSLKPGGVLVYSTCTFAPEENESIIAKLLKRFPDQASIEPITLSIANIQAGLTHWNKKTFPESIKQCIRILPDHLMSGFFIAKIKKRQ